MTQPSSADAPRTGNRQYHIALERGELAEYILLVGDPGRVAKVAQRWDNVELERSNREITTATGSYRGMRISAMSTGMGTDNVEIVFAEVTEITDRPTFIRVGSSGALQPEIRLGDLIISTGAVRLENTSDYYVHPGYPAIAHREVVWALEAACRELGYPYHVGLTATASGFYAPQGRAMRTLPVRYPELAEELRRQRVANLEMESSTLFVLAGLAGLRAGTICAAYAQRVDGTFVEGAAKEAAEARCIDAGLAGIHLLWTQDQQQDGDPRRHLSAVAGGGGAQPQTGTNRK
ncbi:MAG TPA: nucleoside phosphorylase [candidate division Zixibacteria bacterium]|nr:nucleoside phosphorylase [candidate division Zixibacteria bacterium]